MSAAGSNPAPSAQPGSTPAHLAARGSAPGKDQMARRRIFALGGGGFSMEPDNPVLDDYLLNLSGAARPKVCFVPTASGDSPEYVEAFHDALRDRAETSVLWLFAREQQDLRRLVL